MCRSSISSAAPWGTNSMSRASRSVVIEYMCVYSGAVCLCVVWPCSSGEKGEGVGYVGGEGGRYWVREGDGVCDRGVAARELGEARLTLRYARTPANQ